MMTISRAAKTWGVSRQTIYDWIKQGLIAVGQVVDGGPQVVLSTKPPPRQSAKRGRKPTKRAQSNTRAA